MKTEYTIHEGDSVVVRRARKELVPVIEKLIECRDTLRKIHKRLNRIDKGESVTVEGWIVCDVDFARSDCMSAIRDLRLAVSTDYRPDALEAIKDREAARVKDDGCAA